MSGIIAQNSGRHTGLVKASSGGGGVWNLILTQTASASATISFTSGIDSTYDEYVFKWINIHPATDQTNFMFQGNAAGGSGYNETITSTAFQTQHSEADALEQSYETGQDQAEGTAFQEIGHELGTDIDQSSSGVLYLYGPSSTTYQKHWIAEGITYRYNDRIQQLKTAGYFNTTSAIDEIQFKMSSGNMDAGIISLYGIS